MFSPSNIILIRKFDFEKKGTVPKDKYMLVLLQTSTDAIIAPLTTSQDYIPDNHKGVRYVFDDPADCIAIAFQKSYRLEKKAFPSRKTRTSKCRET